MAVYLANTGDGGTQGSPVSTGNSGGISGPAWDSVTTGTGVTLAYDNAHVLGGHPFAVKIATGSTSTISYTVWGASLTGSSISQVWFRVYLYLTGNPAAQYGVWRALNGATLCSGVLITTAGKLLVVNTAGSTITQSTAAIPLNQWFRIEGYVTASATAGQTELRLYKTADASPQNYDEIDTSTASQNTSTAITALRYGVAVNGANIGPYWQASPGASDTGYLGPEAPVSGVPMAFPGPAWRAHFQAGQPRPRLQYQGQLSGQRVIPVTLPVTVTTTGALTDQASKALAAPVTTAGAVQNQAAKTLTGSVATTGTLSRAASRTFTATAATAGALQRAAAKTLTVTVNAAGTLSRSAAKPLTVTAATTASLGRQATRALATSVATAGSLTRSASRAFFAGVTTTGTYAKGYFRTFAVAVTTTGSLGRGIGKILSAIAATAASWFAPFIPGPSQPRVLTITPAGNLAATLAVTPSVPPAVIAVAPAGAQAAVFTIAPAGGHAVTLTVICLAAATGELPGTWEPAPPLTAWPPPPAPVTAAA